MIPSAFSASVSTGLFVHECVRSPQERAVKGTGVWISTCGRGGREGDQTTVSTETLLSGEMQTWGGGRVMWGLRDRWADSRK